MNVRRLGWSGLEIEHGGETLLIDYILDTSQLPLRDDHQPFPPAPVAKASAGLVTHLHADHADPAALAAALRPDAPVFRPAGATGAAPDLELTAYAEAGFAASDLETRVVTAWTSYDVGPFKLHAAPAVDGFGDLQVSWAVECAGVRLLHAGDTLFHSYWWRIAGRYGPITHAFLPINGAIVDFPFLQPPRNQEAVMTPEEAVKAATMLGAPIVTPIHYGSLHRPPGYVETLDPVKRLHAAAEGTDVRVEVCAPGERLELSSETGR